VEEVLALQACTFFLGRGHGVDVLHGKPAPDIFLRAAELLGVPAAMLGIEDSTRRSSGLAAGMRVSLSPIRTRRRTFPGDPCRKNLSEIEKLLLV